MKKILFVTLLLFFSASLQVFAGSVITIQCDDVNPGAEVFINGKVAGACPIDVGVEAGPVQLLARIAVDADHEKLFVKQYNLGDGVRQHVDLVMSATQLTPEAKLRMEQAAAEAKRLKEEAEAEAKRREEAAQAGVILSAAEGGDIESMKNIAQHYDTGLGVEKDPAKAEMWRGKADAAILLALKVAAKEGNIDAMLDIASRYEAGLGIAKDLGKAAFWREQADAAKREKLALAEAKRLAEEAATRQRLENEEAARRAEEAATRRRIAVEEAEAAAQAAREATARSEREEQARAENRAERIRQISYTENIERLLKDNGKNPVSFTTALAISPIASVSDLTEAPTKSSRISRIKNEASFRPATWGKPDSMIARASTQYRDGSAEGARQDSIAADK